VSEQLVQLHVEANEDEQQLSALHGLVGLPTVQHSLSSQHQSARFPARQFPHAELLGGLTTDGAAIGSALAAKKLRGAVKGCTGCVAIVEFAEVAVES
jgi:hypothetical protein